MDTIDFLDEQEGLVAEQVAEDAMDQYLELLIDTTIPLIDIINSDNGGEYLASLSDSDRETLLEQVCLLLNLSIDWGMWDAFEQASSTIEKLESEKNIN